MDQDIDTTTLKALSQVTGDFLRTLQDCERLLSENSKFERTKAVFVDNLAWHNSTEREIKNLRQRVHFHQTKISFIAKPLEVPLLLGIHSEVKGIRRDVAELKGILVNDTARTPGSDSSTSSEEFSALPPDLALRFTKALSVNMPGTFQVQDDLPLSEGFDALIFHFAGSTVNIKPNPGPGQNVPEDPQYLNLIKSKWILERLKESTHFRSVGQESLWAECAREIEGSIREELSRFQRGDLSAPPFEVLSRLPENFFNIWVDEEAPPHPAALTEERPLEEKILELDLPNPYRTRQSTLTIFRKSHVGFRLVSTTKDDQNKDFSSEESVDVSMDHIRLIPTFAVSKDSSSAINNVVLCGNHSQLRSYTLRDTTEVALFQRALTGFRVFHEMLDIKWCIEYQSFGRRGISGSARLQLWHLKPLPRILPPSESPAAGNTHAPIKSPNLRRFWTSGTSQPSGTAIGSRGDGVLLLRPEPPVLVIFTQCEKTYSFFHLQCMSRKATLLSLSIIPC